MFLLGFFIATCIWIAFFDWAKESPPRTEAERAKAIADAVEERVAVPEQVRAYLPTAKGVVENVYLAGYNAGCGGIYPHSAETHLHNGRQTIRSATVHVAVLVSQAYQDGVEQMQAEANRYSSVDPNQLEHAARAVLQANG